MTEDAPATIEAPRAGLAALREEIAGLQAREATRVGEGERHQRALAEALEQQTATPTSCGSSRRHLGTCSLCSPLWWTRPPASATPKRSACIGQAAKQALGSSSDESICSEIGSPSGDSLDVQYW
jgi:hypothetical protein